MSYVGRKTIAEYRRDRKAAPGFHLHHKEQGESTEPKQPVHVIVTNPKDERDKEAGVVLYFEKGENGDAVIRFSDGSCEFYSRRNFKIVDKAVALSPEIRATIHVKGARHKLAKKRA